MKKDYLLELKIEKLSENTPEIKLVRAILTYSSDKGEEVKI